MRNNRVGNKGNLALLCIMAIAVMGVGVSYNAEAGDPITIS